MVNKAAGAHLYYRAALGSPERAAYDAILQAAVKWQGHARVGRAVPCDRALLVAELVCLDNPGLFFCDVRSLTYAGTRERPHNLRCNLGFEMDRRDADALARGVAAAVAPIVARARSMDAPRAIETAHDWLVGSCAYGDDGTRSAHEAWGPLVSGKGVCDGFAKAMKTICDAAGIACIVVTGRAGGACGSGRDDAGPHAWNIVDFAPRNAARPLWRHVDVSFDANLTHTVCRHDYFGLSDDEVAADHMPAHPELLPACATSSGYYRAHGLFADSLGELESIVAGGTGRRDGDVVFQLPVFAGAVTGDVDAIVNRAVCRAPTRRGGSASVWANHARNVFQVHYA